MALIPSLGTSLTGMKTAQAQLDIISRNVANVDTAGYSRKTAQQSNLVRAGYSQGVKLNDIERQVDEGLLKSYLSSYAQTNNYSAKNDYLGKIEVTLGTPQGNNSIAANVGALQTAFDTFATDVTSSANRFNLLNQADTITSRLNSISSEIQSLRGEADLQINADVTEINKLLDTLDNLNNEVVKYSVLSYEGQADLLDQRDQALRELSGLIDISYFKRDSGAIVIQTTTGVTLLDSEPHKLSHNALTQASPTLSYAAGSISGIYVDGQDITNMIKDGELKGLIEVRDSILPSLQSQLDELGANLMQEINAVHNRGTAFPDTPDVLTGTRTFIQVGNSYPQNISILDGDVRFMIIDEAGNQVATTTLKGDIGFTTGSISDMAEDIKNWMTSATGANLPQADVYINAEGKLVIDTGDSAYGFSIIDEASSTPGSEQKDVTIAFDNGNNGVFNQTYQGFSNFFGLNDMFVDNNDDFIYDSKVISLNANLGITEQTIWKFSDIQNGLNFGSIVINPGDTIYDIVNTINDNAALNTSVKASLVPNGNGYMLRIEDMTGKQLEIAETQGNNLFTRLGMAPSNANTAQTIQVKSELKTNPSLITAGVPEFNTSTGKYVMSPAANSIANEMGKIFTKSLNFKQSGTIAQTQSTLASYASTFVGTIASLASSAESSLAYQQELTQSISTKEAKISGVDIDEELGQMIIFQQTYAACAQAFTASKEMLDLLMEVV